ncbi:ABC transporter ATP-binding protein [Pullulanibacillus camelliae]|uniref:ABC transporter ATP-binding protein n=1 Tax=Pullulanibacillus camelliae TaxID=1707096 RepID=A0A8J2VVL5_9BACL|nr:ABC-F family ATP-binding cassette domain-containing protein [Pullulanibacillus camelliae]GGE39502.1 ABC transporter ATP-binding protein [Pullulanibacillus camelliae]
MSLITVERLSHTFGDKTVFQNINFRLLNGEKVGLVGPNGAGKSTLIKLLTGELLPDEGTIKWASKVRFGHLQQHIGLKPGLTLRAFLKRAFQEHFQIEKQGIKISEGMATANAEELEVLLDKYGRIQEWLEQHDFYAIDAKVDHVADGLGLMALGMDSDVTHLSGGQRTKLLLAKLLLEQPDVLLLDEPTNYLDTAHIDWLTGYLKSYPHAFILISHDTAFMNEVVHLIYHLEHQRLTRYVGNYTAFLKQSEQRERQWLEAFNRQQKEIEKLETYIAKNKARAATARQAKSREKRLEKIERLEKPTQVPKPRFYFPTREASVRLVCQADGLTVGYERPLFPKLDLKLERGQKVAIVGHNGIGKTTLLKTLLGWQRPIAGQVTIGDRVSPAYFEQEHLLPNETPLEFIWRAFPQYEQKSIRAALARCGLSERHLRQPLPVLSGGEQTKVRLCYWTLAPSNWLILDEPTNHLDVKAKASLKEALMAYKGTILLVSHECSFFEDWVTHVWDSETWIN